MFVTGVGYQSRSSSVGRGFEPVLGQDAVPGLIHQLPYCPPCLLPPPFTSSFEMDLRRLPC